ncbi:MAG: restriction endonuclease subunit S [Raineya sp.]|jgi:type I restriction enzyme S subunit|nr:restriction endonuclease subunit S [Raineya sp.]
MKWEKVEIGKVSKVISGFAFKSKDFQPIGTPIVKIKSIKDENIVLDESDCVDSAIEVPIRFHLSKGDILISLTGSHITLPSSVVGRVAKYRHETNSYLNQRAGKFINIDNDRCHKDYLFYFLLQKETLTKIANKAQGAANQANISPGDVEGVEINLPPLPTQRKIASILSAYDDLIENNLKRIKLLEEKARIEYKSIQKNEKLEFRKAVDVLQFSTGKLNSNAAVPNGQYPFFTCGQEILRTNTFSLDEEVVLLGGNNASAIYPVFYYKGKFDAYQRTYIIKPKPKVYLSFKYLYYFWESKLDYLKNISTGAATKFLTLKILNDIDVPLPSKKVMEEYEMLTEPIFKFKAILAEQNTKLREARDILLPKLMNGQIEV